MTLASAFVLLFLVVDPIRNTPFFVAALERVAPERLRRVVLRELCFALVLMVAFLSLGRPLLGVLGISEPALSIVGSAILFLIAVRMEFPQSGGAAAEEFDGEPLLVPLAVPYIRGLRGWRARWSCSPAAGSQRGSGGAD